jgi:hypothetical protein
MLHFSSIAHFVLSFQVLKSQAEVKRAIGDKSLLRQTFGIWVATERSKLLASVRDTRLTRDCFTRWTNRREGIRQLEGMSFRFQQSRDSY